MKRSLLNGILGVAALGLAAAVLFSQTKEEKGPPLTPFAAEAINKIRIEHPGAPLIELTKQSGKWSLSAPVKTEADLMEVNALLALGSLEAQTTLDPAQVSLKDVGLDPPKYDIGLNDQKLEFGGEEPIKFRRYIRSNGKIMLVSDPPSAALDADYSDLVSKSLLPDGAEILSITLPGLGIARSADSKSWQLTPANANDTADAKQKLVDTWKNARALWNAAAPKEGSKGEAVTVTTKTGAIQFIIAKREPQLVLERPDLGVSYTLSAELMKDMLGLPEEKKDAKVEEPKEEKPVEAAPAQK